jgi:hypothetical protein
MLRFYHPPVTGWDHFKVGQMVWPNLRPNLLMEDLMKKARYRRRRVMVITPSGARRIWTVPVQGFKETKAVMARHGFHIITR